VWFNEAYNSAITSLDLGLLQRNFEFLEPVSRIIDACFPESKTMLDYAGGYGVFVRLMRDRGFNYFRQDPYCENIFAKHFDSADHAISRFDVVTAFEVFEHFKDPSTELPTILLNGNNIIFSTVLIPANAADIENWWYIAPETGQHLSFYSRLSLEKLAADFGKKFYSNGTNLHIFTDRSLDNKQLDYAFNGKLKEGFFKSKNSFIKERPSLLQSDFEYVRGLLNR